MSLLFHFSALFLDWIIKRCFKILNFPKKPLFSLSLLSKFDGQVYPVSIYTPEVRQNKTSYKKTISDILQISKGLQQSGTEVKINSVDTRSCWESR